MVLPFADFSYTWAYDICYLSVSCWFLIIQYPPESTLSLELQSHILFLNLFYIWNYNIMKSFSPHPFLPLKANLLSFKIVVSFFVNCCYVHICINLEISFFLSFSTYLFFKQSFFHFTYLPRFLLCYLLPLPVNLLHPNPHLLHKRVRLPISESKESDTSFWGSTKALHSMSRLS